MNALGIHAYHIDAAPQCIRDGDSFFEPPTQADYRAGDVVYKATDTAKIHPYIVIAMPYWMRYNNRKTGEVKALFYSGVNVLRLDKSSQDNIHGVEHYVRANPQPPIPSEILAGLNAAR